MALLTADPFAVSLGQRDIEHQREHGSSDIDGQSASRQETGPRCRCAATQYTLVPGLHNPYHPVTKGLCASGERADDEGDGLLGPLAVPT